MSNLLNAQAKCVCGRHLDRFHCPHCGSRSVYVIVSKKNQHCIADPITHKVTECEFKVIRCRTCGDIFDEWQLQFHCEAPPLLVKQSVPKEERVEVARRDIASLLKSAGVIDEFGNKKE